MIRTIFTNKFRAGFRGELSLSRSFYKYGVLFDDFFFYTFENLVLFLSLFDYNIITTAPLFQMSKKIKKDHQNIFTGPFPPVNKTTYFVFHPGVSHIPIFTPKWIFIFISRNFSYRNYRQYVCFYVGVFFFTFSVWKILLKFI